MAQIFEVGGCVRDSLLGLSSKDIDFTFVCENSKNIEEGWGEMITWLMQQKFKIFLQTPDCFTVRAKFPQGHIHEGLVADFVMARKEIGYVEGTRKPVLVLGTLEDDLIRRDFTVNAIAKDLKGNLIDPLNGVEDIKNKILKTPQNPLKTLNEDPLRILRAIRFSITKDFIISREVLAAMKQEGILEKLRVTVSQERIREELEKMFKHDSKKTLRTLFNIDGVFIPGLLDVIFGDSLWLSPTFKKIKKK